MDDKEYERMKRIVQNYQKYWGALGIFFILTALNILTINSFDSYLLFSLFSCTFFTVAYGTQGIAISLIILLLVGGCWLCSKKNPIALYIVLVCYILDTIFVFINIAKGSTSVIIDAVCHVIYFREFILAIKSMKELQNEIPESKTLLTMKTLQLIYREIGQDNFNVEESENVMENNTDDSKSDILNDSKTTHQD